MQYICCKVVSLAGPLFVGEAVFLFSFYLSVVDARAVQNVFQFQEVSSSALLARTQTNCMNIISFILIINVMSMAERNS